MVLLLVALELSLLERQRRSFYKTRAWRGLSDAREGARWLVGTILRSVARPRGGFGRLVGTIECGDNLLEDILAVDAAQDDNASGSQERESCADLDGFSEASPEKPVIRLRKD